MSNIKTIILNKLITNEEYRTRVIPFIKSEYFEKKEHKILFEHIYDYGTKYGKAPSFDALYVEIKDDTGFDEKVKEKVDELISDVKSVNKSIDLEWLVDSTEKFCRTMALYNAINTSAAIFAGEEKSYNKEAIPLILQEALSVTFDPCIGHDYLDDYEHRYDYYHRKEEKIPFDIDIINDITDGGFSKKTLNLFYAGPHVGKTAIMCHMAAANLLSGKNVLYITLEMSEEQIAKRIDANTLRIAISDIPLVGKKDYFNKVEALKKKTSGILKIKEFPTSTASINNVRSLLEDLNLKQGFIPDIIYVDYLNLLISSRMKGGQNVNSYFIIKSISEEMRGLAVEKNFAIVSASQFNRSGSSTSEPGMAEISESFSLNFIADFVLGLVTTEELIEKGIIMCKQLKNRYVDVNRKNKFYLGFDRSRMTFFTFGEESDEGGTPPNLNGSVAQKLKDATEKEEKSYEGFKF